MGLQGYVDAKSNETIGCAAAPISAPSFSRKRESIRLQPSQPREIKYESQQRHPRENGDSGSLARYEWPDRDDKEDALKMLDRLSRELHFLVSQTYFDYAV